MLRFFLAVLIMSWCSLSKAQTSLQLGDVLLQPLDCWACSLIEAEEETIYSHIGIVVSEKPLLVAEAFGTVRVVGLNEFNQKTQKDQQIKVLRLKESIALAQLANKAEEFFGLYSFFFDGKKYDHYFLWNNFDQNGEEKFYCSELVTKLLEVTLGVSVPLKRMHFNKNADLWFQYFKGQVPAGEWGNSPADFERSSLFETVGVL
jgi:hypothetical protein